MVLIATAVVVLLTAVVVVVVLLSSTSNGVATRGHSVASGKKHDVGWKANGCLHVTPRFCPVRGTNHRVCS